MSDEISPLPWRAEGVGGGQTYPEIDGRSRFCIASEDGDFPVDRYGIWKQANAEYIVKACNEYPILSQRLQEAEEWVTELQKSAEKSKDYMGH